MYLRGLPVRNATLQTGPSEDTTIDDHEAEYEGREEDHPRALVAQILPPVSRCAPSQTQ